MIDAMVTDEEDRMSMDIFNCDSDFSRNCYASMRTPPPPSGAAPVPDSNWSSLRHTAILGEQKAQMPLLIRVRHGRMLVGATTFVTVLMLLVGVFMEGVPVGSRDSIASVDDLNEYNFYTGTIAAMLAKPFEMALTFFVPVLSLVLSPRNSLQNDSMSWRALLFFVEGVFTALLTGVFSTLNVQQLDPLVVPVIIASDLSSMSSTSGSVQSTSDLTFSLRPTTDTLLRTAILPVHTKATESVCQGRGGWPNIATTFAFFANDWLIDLLPNGCEPEYSHNTSIGQGSTPSTTESNNASGIDKFNASLSANLLLYAMFFSQTLLAWEGLSYLENNSLAQFQDEIASWRAMEDSNVDSITKTEFQIAASAMLQKTLDEQSLRLGLNFNTNAVSFNASHVKLSSDIGFDAVTIEIPFDEHAIADNRSTTAAMTPASTSVTSSNSSILYKLRSITACGETACLIPPPGNSFAATATLGDTAYTQWNVESQIQAFAACIFEDGSEYLTTDYLHGSSCTRRSTTSFLVYSFGRRVVADDVTVEVSSSNNLLMVTNMQRYHTITLGRLSWHTKDLASDFNAACGLVESCTGISFLLENASSTASARHLIVGENDLPVDSLGDFDGLYSQWTPLAMVTTPTDMQGDLLFQRNVLKNTWDLDGLCSTSVDVFATQVEENHWYMSYGLQESYTAALFLLFQNAVVRHEKQSADGSRTLNFAGSSTHVTLEARIPLPSALISIIGSAIVLAAALGIVIAGRRKQCAIQSDVGVEEIAKVLLVDHRFPRLVLDCTLDDPGARTRRQLHSFHITAIVLHQEEPQPSGIFIRYPPHA